MAFGQDQTGQSRSSSRPDRTVIQQFILPSLISAGVTALLLGMLLAAFTLLTLSYLPMLFVIFLAAFFLLIRAYYYIWKPKTFLAHTGVWATILLATLGSGGVHLAISYIAWSYCDYPMKKVSPEGLLTVTILDMFSFAVLAFILWVVITIEQIELRRKRPP